MKGANEYARLFGRERHGRLMLWPGHHARGKTFEIWILNKNNLSNVISYPSESNGDIKVYGAIRGQVGWTEEYGWIHVGKWCDDFNDIVAERRKIANFNAKAAEEAHKKSELDRNKRIEELLSEYE